MGLRVCLPPELGHAPSLLLGFQGFNVQLPDLPSSSFRYPSPAGLPPDDGAFVDGHNGGQFPEAESGPFPEALEFVRCNVTTSSPIGILRREHGAAAPVNPSCAAGRRGQEPSGWCDQLAVPVSLAY